MLSDLILSRILARISLVMLNSDIWHVNCTFLQCLFLKIPFNSIHHSTPPFAPSNSSYNPTLSLKIFSLLTIGTYMQAQDIVSM